ncbi:MAG: anthranilate synthase component I [Desulfotomaculales bacterium]
MHPSHREYTTLARNFAVVPLWKEMPCSGIAPLDAVRRLGRRAAYLLESAEGRTTAGRYSFIGCDPWATLIFDGHTSRFLESGGSFALQCQPLAALKDILGRWRAPELGDLPRFYGGAVGYLGYDLVRCFERLPALATRDMAYPDMMLVFTRSTLVFDHLNRRLFVITLTHPGNDPASSYAAGRARIEELLAHVEDDVPPEKGEIPSRPASHLATPTLSREQFLRRVRRAREFIAGGEILQVVLSVRWQLPFAGDPLAVYERLRALNPSPYLFYLGFGDLAVIGSSPEMLVRVEDGEVITHPIAGTRPRGTTPQEDEALAGELLADPKERAEHVMLVDLARNDLGRVCRPSSVQVTRFMTCEKYSHVMHLVSEVRGRLVPEKSPLDALVACFPAGTVTGAPKVRAMEIIEELEPRRRGLYAGAVGYFSFTGNMDTCIAIRCLVLHQGKAYVQAGAGIVADSVPEKEYLEVCHKAGPLFSVLGGGDLLAAGDR